MPLLEIVQTRYVNATVRLDESTAEQINQYAAFLHASPHEIVDKAVAYVFSKDRDFQEFLRTPDAARVPQKLRVRRVGPAVEGMALQNGHASNAAQEPVKSGKGVEAVSDSRSRS
jgi:hypothetical protein